MVGVLEKLCSEGAHMQRRELLAILGGVAVLPIMARAQQAGRMRRIGVLMAHAETDPEYRNYLAAFWEELHKLGWTEGRNIQVDTRWGALDDAEERLRSAAELIALQPDLIVSQNTPPTQTVLQQTRTVPVIFVIVADPVGSGFVSNLARPNGNAAGFMIMEPTVVSKWLELLKEMAPRINRISFSFNPETTPYREIFLKPFRAAALSLAIEANATPINNITDLETVFAAETGRPGAGVIIMPDGFMNVHRAEVVALAARYRVPTIYPWRFFTELGGLLSYGNEQRDSFRLAAGYADRILKGERPSELPVQAPVRFELVINMKAADALGLDVPLRLQQLADKIIE
jgi:putative ABC transport system substrate-binding protein